MTRAILTDNEKAAFQQLEKAGSLPRQSMDTRTKITFSRLVKKGWASIEGGVFAPSAFTSAPKSPKNRVEQVKKSPSRPTGKLKETRERMLHNRKILIREVYFRRRFQESINGRRAA